MKVLSIDPGFKRLGFALWNGEALIYSDIIGIERNETETWNEYITRGVLFFHEWFSIFLRLHKPEVIIMETLPPVSSSSGFNSSTQVSLVFMTLAAIIIAANKTIPPVKIEYLAAQYWKKKFIGKNKVTKSQVRSKVLELFPDIRREKKITEIPFDQTDSIGLGLVFINDRIDRERQDT